MAEATVRVWKNGWFHTGDVLKVDEAGNYYFVDRVKDVIRRRGENISSYEVELEVLSFPSVNAAAAYGALVDTGEGEVMIAVESTNGTKIDPLQLTEHLIKRLPYFMVPRFVRTVSSLPRSTTDKIDKTTLRSEGVTPDTWDREQAGIRLRRPR
ncbi:MAG: AMP-binding enzyme [Thalassospira sp.]|uniref:AMP-binding enzyme n=1 Tax=Thalassospira sp. TaxID=1912094 RepID=UPI003A8C527C